MNNIGERIKYLRTNQKMTAQELGDKIGRSKSNISGYENGKFEPSAQTIIAICKYFKVSPNWLLLGEEFQNQNEALVLTSDRNLFCEGIPLSEDESDIISMYRILDDRDKEDLYEIALSKYQRTTGERGSIYSTYTDEEKGKSAPEDGKKTSYGIA